jgi:HAD superfamily hydrolase (TIGR01509 family)
MTIKAILFDLDGTLVDSNDRHVAAWEKAFARHGQHVPRDRIRSQIGKGGDTFVPALLPDLSDDEQEALADAHGEVFQGEHLDAVEAFPGAHDLVARVKAAGLKVALASSAAQKELDHYADLLGIRDLVDVTTTADDVKTSKPAPDIVAVALEKLGVAADEALFVGDTPYDIEAGARAGVRTVAVLSGGFPREALASAVAVYDDAAALVGAWPDWVER